MAICEPEIGICNHKEMKCMCSMPDVPSPLNAFCMRLDTCIVTLMIVISKRLSFYGGDGERRNEG